MYCSLPDLSINELYRQNFFDMHILHKKHNQQEEVDAYLDWHKNRVKDYISVFIEKHNLTHMKREDAVKIARHHICAAMEHMPLDNFYNQFVDQQFLSINKPTI